MEDEEEESLTVEVLCTCMVVPDAAAAEADSYTQSAIIRERHLLLPGSDSYWRWVPYNGRLLFYDKKLKMMQDIYIGKDCDNGDAEDDDDGSYRKAVAALKKGLALALSDYYPFAGRLAHAAAATDEGGGARLEILCDGQGVLFVEGRTRARFESVARDNFQITDFFHALAPPPPPPPQDDDECQQAAFDVPLLAVQVTRFLEGEMAVGCIHSHVLGDGTSFWNFMVAWAAYAKCAMQAAPQCVDDHHRPVHDRRLLDFINAQVGRPDDDETQEATSPLDICWSHTTTPPGHSQDATPKPPLLSRVFHVTHDVLLQMKAHANSTSSIQHEDHLSMCGKRDYTRYEALCAHVWRSVVEARCLEDEAKVGLVVLADVRRRVEPNIPDGYVGNAVIARTVMATKGELLGEAISETCARIRETIRKITDCSIKKEMGSLGGIRRAQLGMWGRSFVCLNVVSSPRFPVFEVDFGWGPPCCARPVSVGMYGRHHVMFAHNRGALVLFPAKDGGIDLCITLQHAPMHKLLADNTLFSTLVQG